VSTGKFRDDLYFRIRVLTLDLPPLRSYKDNLEVLAAVFVQQAAQKHGRRVSGISQAAMALLRGYDYPGNVRELKNLVEHAVIMSESEEIQPADLAGSLRKHASTPTPAPAKAKNPKSLRAMRESWLEPLERAYLTELLEACSGNVRAASRRAGVTAATFYSLMSKRGVKLSRRPEA